MLDSPYQSGAQGRWHSAARLAKQSMSAPSADAEHFRRLLLELEQDLLALEQTGDEAAKTVELDQSRVGRLSRMDALQNQAMQLETERRREVELARIDAALERMESDDFGYCVSCGEAIGKKRLEMDPSTPLCIDCAKAH